MIPRFRQRREFAPCIAGWIIDFMRCDGHGIDTTSSNRVNLSVESGNTDRAARALHRRQRPPGILGRIIFEDDIQCAHVDIPSKAANDEDFAVHSYGSRMTEPAWHRRPLPPPVRCRIVFLVERLRVYSKRGTPEDVNLSVSRG